MKPAPDVVAATAPPADAAPPAAAPARSSRAPWWIVPVVIVGLIGLALVFTSRRTTDRVADAGSKATPTATMPVQQPADTGTLVPVNESTASDRSTTIAPATPAGSPQAYGGPGQPVTATGARVPAVLAPQQPVTATRSPGPIAAAPQPTPAVSTAPVPVTPPPSAPVVATPAPASPLPQEPPQPQQPQPAKRHAGVSEREAIGIARTFMLDNDAYAVDPDCLSIRSNGYVNVGYTLEVWDVCDSGSGSRRLGRWRVDALTGDLFRQSEDGRYKKP